MSMQELRQASQHPDSPIPAVSQRPTSTTPSTPLASQPQPQQPARDNSSTEAAHDLGPLPTAPEGQPGSLQEAYEECVTWRRNLFIVPFGAAGKQFVEEIARLVRIFSDAAPNRERAWTSIAVACHLLLQKPHGQGSSSEHGTHLTRRLAVWKSGDINTLLRECRCIQAHLPAHHTRNVDQSGQIDDTLFSKLVCSGKTQSAIRMVCSSGSGGVLSMSDTVSGSPGSTVRDILLDKHPQPAVPPDDALLQGHDAATPQDPILFARLTGALIKQISRQMSGAAGPSGLDSDAWKRMLTCFAAASDQLCAAMAEAGKRLCTQEVPPEELSSFTAARLIPLDKQPGVRPIAVGEVFRRLIGKAVMKIIQYDAMHATAPRQLCVGVPSGCEAAVHTMTDMLVSPEVEGVLLVDATNAFNAMNRTAALHNVPLVCPALGQVFKNTYSSPCRLFVSGGGEIRSQEGTCQGDPLAMAIYAVAMMPLIDKLSECCPDVVQLWYADDDAGGGQLLNLRQYWDGILEHGPGYGYYPNANKTTLIVKEQHSALALQLFRDTGIRVVTEGARYLGGALGTTVFCEEYITDLIDKWTLQVDRLAEVATTQPHAAYEVFVKGLVSKWRYHLRVLSCPAHLLARLDAAITDKLLPALSGHSCSEESALRKLLSLPARFGGMAIPVPSVEAEKEFSASRQIVAPVAACIRPPEHPTSTNETTQTDQLNEAIALSRQEAGRIRREKAAQATGLVSELRPDLTATQALLVENAAEKGVSSWVTAEPSSQMQMVLNKSDFRDAFCIRYGLQPDGLPLTCVCGAANTIDHAMMCPAGGYPMARHNEIRDLLADVMREAVRDVEVEPPLLPYDGERLQGRTANRSAGARLDIRACGFWTRQQDAFFDIRVTHPKASLLSRQEVISQLRTHERMKKRQYGERVTAVDRGTFTPLVFSTSGMIGRECSMALKTLACLIAEKNVDLHVSVIMGQLRCKLSVCLMRWAVTCLRGSRSSYRRNRMNFTTMCRLRAA